MEIQKRIIACVRDLLVIAERDVKLDADMESGLGMDSLDKVELVMALEEEFEIEIADADAEKCKTVADIVALVQRVAS